MTAKKPKRRPRKPRETTVQLIDRYLLSTVQINLNGEATCVPAVEAIMLQLFAKTNAGSARASRVLSKYENLAERDEGHSLKLEFPDNEYTRSFAAEIGTKDNNHE